ncbi:receptor homology region, transmembrane domain- and RING domain-containing protein 3-like [Olea europaea var. sylvestris]|uniref:receptor homology region, transmembrane domain- and RING domain-containing protein 3-like n=1 Tax=Olea europaea var. sylvestris TaxID=158386 RepID=UPI000C1CFC71|nr:receptor homology region, transmembrane domain- and RING domain-containing protein 3-like [Olea europaea var. sylvestris]
MVKFWVLLFYCLVSLMSAFTAFRIVVSIRNTTLSSEGIESNSAPRVNVFGKRGSLYIEPSDVKQNGTVGLVSFIPSRKESAGTIHFHFLFFLSTTVCAVSALLAIGYYLDKWREQSQHAWMENAMPSPKFSEVMHDVSASSTCHICLEDYNVADKLRVLPCHHRFHAYCVDPWLALFQTTCPVCRVDVSQVRVTIERIRRIENATADLRRNANRLVNRFFLFQAGIFFFAQWDLPSEHNIFVLSLSLIASFRLAYAFPLISLDLQHMYNEIDSIKAIDYRVARYFRIWRLCLVTCFISLAVGFAVVLPIALVTKTSPAFYCKICFAVMLGTYTMQS